MTLGIEFLLAADIRVAAADTRFGQMEVRRGIYPFGGATIRLPRQAGWGNAMRWLLTGDEFDAAEAHAHRAGAGSRAPTPPRHRPPHATSRTPSLIVPLRSGSGRCLASAHLARDEGDGAAIDAVATGDDEVVRHCRRRRGVQSFIERREARFQGS